MEEAYIQHRMTNAKRGTEGGEDDPIHLLFWINKKQLFSWKFSQEHVYKLFI